MFLILRPLRLLFKALVIESTPTQMSYGLALGVLLGLYPKAISWPWSWDSGLPPRASISRSRPAQQWRRHLRHRGSIRPLIRLADTC